MTQLSSGSGISFKDTLNESYKAEPIESVLDKEIDVTGVEFPPKDPKDKLDATILVCGGRRYVTFSAVVAEQARKRLQPAIAAGKVPIHCKVVKPRGKQYITLE